MASSERTAAMLPPFVAARVKPGHTFDYDPPSGITVMSRWTCSECGDAVLTSGDVGVVYGGATERTCAESVAFWTEVRDA
jgi:hypothetical protein